MQDMQDMQEIQASLDAKCQGLGLSCHPFLVGWYNSMVGHPSFHLPYSHDTLAMVVLSSPSMFERVFLPYICSLTYTEDEQDSLNQCFIKFFSKLTSTFPFDVDIIHDFAIHPASRRPHALVQTAGHVAGAARFYQRKDVDPDPWPKEKKLYGVSMHPRYGGWFSFRGVLIFKSVQVPKLHQSEPVDCVPEQSMRRQLLEKFNFCYKDWSFRDIIMDEVEERYSAEQKLYYGSVGRDKEAVIKDLRRRLMKKAGD